MCCNYSYILCVSVYRSCILFCTSPACCIISITEAASCSALLLSAASSASQKLRPVLHFCPAASSASQKLRPVLRFSCLLHHQHHRSCVLFCTSALLHHQHHRSCVLFCISPVCCNISITEAASCSALLLSAATSASQKLRSVLHFSCLLSAVSSASPQHSSSSNTLKPKHQQSASSLP